MTQIPQELIDRLRKCCEWLGKEMPEKFQFTRYDHFYLKTKNLGDDILVDFNKVNPILSDPLCEYPNALHRIVKEATGKEFEIRITIGFTYDIFIYGDATVKEIQTDKKFPLHAEIEACCIAIEEIIK